MQRLEDFASKPVATTVECCNAPTFGLKLDRVTARKIIQLMLKENALVKISEELIIDRAALDKLISDVRVSSPEIPNSVSVNLRI